MQFNLLQLFMKIYNAYNMHYEYLYHALYKGLQ